MIIAWIIIALLFSALFSGSEIAFISASKVKVELLRKRGTRNGNILSRFFEYPTSFLGSMLVGNNIALVVFSFLMTNWLTPLYADSLGSEPLILLVNTIIITLIVLIFGEFFPKTIFRIFAEDLLYWLAIPLGIIKYIISIPTSITLGLSNRLLNLFFKTPMRTIDSAFTRADLELFLKDTIDESQEDIDKELIEAALQLPNVRVRDCMVPRREIEDIDINDDIEKLVSLFIETKLSRLLVTKDDIDNVLGYVHHQQMLSEPDSIAALVLKLDFVPEAMKVQDLMNKFIKDETNIACVVDEFGGTAGIITLEDILEELFGEIEDEHDQEEYVESKISETEFIFSGRLEINYLNHKYEDQLLFPEGDYNTLSGYLVAQTSTIPERGETIVLNGYMYIPELVSDTKIEMVRIIKMETPDEEMDS